MSFVPSLQISVKQLLENRPALGIFSFCAVLSSIVSLLVCIENIYGVLMTEVTFFPIKFSDPLVLCR